MTAPVQVVIAGGGTAGHTVPALAVARALVKRGFDPATIHFVGSKRGLEARLVPEAGFAITLLPGRGLARSLTPSNVGAAIGLLVALARAVWLVARWRPRVVLSVGGYAGFPAAAGAVIGRVPLVLAEQNAVAGASNRAVARFARAAAVQFEGTGLPREVVTGNPVRAEVLAVDRSPAGRQAARRRLGLPDDRVVVVAAGGSLGSRRINEAMVGLAERWAARSDVAIRHVVGRRDWSEISARPLPIPEGGLLRQMVEYEGAMADVYAAADVGVFRAGGSTVSELAVTGLPSVLVPLPIAPGDHQRANAAALERAGGAVVVLDSDLTAERLDELLSPLVSSPAILARMSTAAAAVGRPDAAERVAALVELNARR